MGAAIYALWSHSPSGRYLGDGDPTVTATH